MEKLRTEEEVAAFEKENMEKYKYYLFQKGYKVITAKNATEISKKYNLKKAITDIDFGILEGKMWSAMTIRTHYNTYPENDRPNWLNHLASLHDDILICFIHRCAWVIANIYPNNNNMPKNYNYGKELYAQLKNLEVMKTSFADALKGEGWWFTLYEFGKIRGFIEGVNWVLGEEWKFNENDYDFKKPNYMDWDCFYDYLKARSKNRKKHLGQEKSDIFDMILDISKK